MKKTIWYLVTKKDSRYSASIIATSRKDAQNYNNSVAGLGGTLTKMDRPGEYKPSGYFLGVYVTPSAQAAIRAYNHGRDIF